MSRPDTTSRRQTVGVTSPEVEAYLAAVDEPKRSTLNDLRKTILELLPDAEECISYGMPAYKVEGKVVAGFAAFKNHLAYLPHSGSVISTIPELASYTQTKGSLHFPIDEPLPRYIVSKLIDARLRLAGLD